MKQKLIMKEWELFEIVQQHNYSNCAFVFDAILTRFEEAYNLKMVKPIADEHEACIKNKIAILIKQWKNCSGGGARNKFKEKTHSSFIEIEIERDLSGLVLPSYKKGPSNADKAEHLQLIVNENQRLKAEIDELKLIMESKRRNRKSYFECGRRQKKRIYHSIEQRLVGSIEQYGLKMDKVILIDKNAQTTGDFKIIEKNEAADMATILHVKDYYLLSDHCYVALRKHISPDWPSIHYLRQYRSHLNQLFQMVRIEQPNGYYSSIKAKLSYIIQYSPQTFVNLDKIKIKISADGTNIGKNLKILNVAFSVINEGQVSRTSKGNYIISMFEIEKESYETISNCFKYLNEEINGLKSIEVVTDEVSKEVPIEYYVCADMKMLLNLLGLQAANSNTPCVWCKCAKKEFFDLNKEWSIKYDESKVGFIRSVSELMENKAKKPPLITCIPLQNYIVDYLHLFLRIGDKLLQLLINHIVKIDSIKIADGQFSSKKYPLLAKFENHLNVDCKIKCNFFINPTQVNLTVKQFTGPDYHKLFKNIKIKEVFGDLHEKSAVIERIWRNFYEIYNEIKENGIKHDKIKAHTRDWLELYLSVYDPKEVTPYMHTFVYHLAEMVETHGDVNGFSTQGLERLNELCTRYYFLANNKRSSALEQLMNTRQRLEACQIRKQIDFDRAGVDLMTSQVTPNDVKGTKVKKRKKNDDDDDDNADN